MAERPWFVGAWRRRSIAVPGGEPVEPCEAWWVQTGEWFVDVRRTLDGQEDNGLPYSSTRAFAGRFEIAEGEVRWHLLLDTDGLAPRTDRAAAAGLWLSAADPLLMIEDAPGRFREEWIQHAPVGQLRSSISATSIEVAIGPFRAGLVGEGDALCARVWNGATLIVAVDRPLPLGCATP